MRPVVRVTVNGQPFRDVMMTRAEAQAYCPDGVTLRDDWSPDALSIVHMLRAQFVARISGCRGPGTYRMCNAAIEQMETAISADPTSPSGMSFRGTPIDHDQSVWCDFDVAQAENEMTHRGRLAPLAPVGSGVASVTEGPSVSKRIPPDPDAVKAEIAELEQRLLERHWKHNGGDVEVNWNALAALAYELGARVR